MPGTPPSSPATSPLPGAAPTLPKATVQLQAPTQPIGTTPPSLTQASTIKVEDDAEEQAAEGLVNVLSGIGLAASIALLVFQILQAKLWIDVEDNPRVGDWSLLMETPES